MVEAVDAPGYAIQPRDLALVISPSETVMSELYLAAAEDVLVLPKGRALDHLLMAQQLGTAIYAVKHLPNLVAKDIAVIGQGSAGLFLNYMCRRLGARKIIGIDNIEARVAAGPRFGATHMINNARQDPVRTLSEFTSGNLVDLVIEAAGEVETINLAPKLARPGGYLHYFGIPRATTFDFDFYELFRKYLHTTSLSGTAFEPGRQSFRQALDIIAGGEIDVAPVLTHRLPFERAAHGYEMARTRSDGAIKIVIEMPGYHTYMMEEHQVGKRSQRA